MRNPIQETLHGPVREHQQPQTVMARVLTLISMRLSAPERPLSLRSHPIISDYLFV